MNSIALSACRATEPLSAARLYMNNYDTIVRAILGGQLKTRH